MATTGSIFGSGSPVIEGNKQSMPAANRLGSIVREGQDQGQLMFARNQGE